MTDNIKGNPVRAMMKGAIRRLGLEEPVLQGLFAARLLAEQAYFIVRGRPQPSEAILVVGSARSGTTWLGNIVAATPGTQLIFEPLNPNWIREAQRLTGQDTTRRYILSWYLQAGGRYPEWHNFLERVLRGQVRHRWTDAERTATFPRRFAIKMVRANLMLGYLYDNFQPRIIYLVRHPCAVIASRLYFDWRSELAWLLRQQALVEDYLLPWLGLMAREEDILGAHTISWAVENMVATRELVGRPHLAVTFEELCLEPEKQADRIFDWLGLKQPAGLAALMQRPSRLSRAAYESTVARLSSWQKQLSQEEQRRILDWAHRLGITLYNDTILPK